MAFPVLYAYTDCNSVCAFAGIGEVQPLKLMLKNKEFQRVLQNLGEDWSVSPELCKGLESFVCMCPVSR